MVGLLLSACSSVPSDEPAPLQPAPAELQQELIRQHQSTIMRTQTDFPKALKGGPGFTQETAWKILIKDRDAVSFEYLVLGRLGLGERQLQSLVEDKGRYYDMHIIDVERDGKTIPWNSGLISLPTSRQCNSFHALLCHSLVPACRCCLRCSGVHCCTDGAGIR